jgi:hypothetical protein
MKKTITKAILLFIVVLGATLQQAAATNYTTVVGFFPNLWQNSNNWVGNNAPPITVPIGDTVFINHDIYVSSGLNIKCNGVIVIGNDGTLDIRDSLTLNDGSVLINDGKIINGNAIFPVAVFINKGHLINNNDFRNRNTGKFFNKLGGIIDNNSEFDQTSTARIMNEFGSQFINNNGGIFTVTIGGIQNDGLLHNKTGSQTENYAAIINNLYMIADGLITNEDSIINTGLLTQSSGAFIYNNSLLKNSTGASFIANGDIENSAIISNQGILDLYGLTEIKALGELNNGGNPNTHTNNYGVIDNKGSINNSGPFTNQLSGELNNLTSGEIINTFSGIFANNGNLTNANDIINYGLMQNNSGALLHNTLNGNINIDATVNSYFENRSDLNNEGTINNSSYFTNFATGILNNNFVLTNESTGNFTNYGEFNNLNDFTNNGYITNVLNGTFNNTAYFTSLSGTIANYGAILNTGAAEFRNYDIMNLNTGSKLQNSALLVNVAGSATALGDTLQNKATGSFISNGMVNILTFGVLLNSGSMSIGNFGVLNNDWDMINNSKINNSGLINNLAQGYLFNNDTILNTGTFTNDGKLYTDAEAYIQKDILGTGSISPGITNHGQLVIDNSTQDFNGKNIILDIDASNINDKIITTGAASLDGAIINVYLNGYTPMPLDAFTIIDATAFTTVMPTVNLPFIPNPSLSWLPPTFVNGKLVIQISSAPLAVTDINFSAELITNNNVLLNWSFQAPIDAKVFEIEHSIDAIIFEKIGTVTADKNTTKYNFIDKQPAIADNFYRIKTIDASNKISYSKIEKVNIQSQNTAITLYPNPATTDINVVGIDKNAIVEIFDVNGRKISAMAMSTNNINIASLPTGLYQIKVINQGITSYHKFLKQ